MISIRRASIVGLLVVGGACALPAKTAEQVLDEARGLYRSKEFDSTATLIRGFLADSGKHPLTEHLVPLLMESLVRGGTTGVSPRLMEIYVAKFPRSPYLPRMYYLDGIVKARTRQAHAAIFSFSQALRGGVSRELDSLVHHNVLLLCEEALTPGEVASLLGRGDLHGSVHEALMYGLARKHYVTNQYPRAAKVAQDFLERFPDSRYSSTVKRIAQSSDRDMDSEVRVGLVAPLSGYDSDIGRAILRGAQLALDEHNRSHQVQVRLIISDTRSNMVETARRTLELVNDFSVPVLIGPVLSPNAVVSAAILLERDAAMISPTATDDGIAELGPNIFQMNVTTGMLGKRLAQYAKQNLNITEFALLTPLTDYGRSLAEAFKAEVRRIGGEVVFEEYFDEGTPDLRPQFTALRQRLFERKKRRDSVVAAENGTSPRHSPRYEAAFMEDSSLSVGGLFVPAQAEDVAMIAPQVYFYKIRTQMLGATGWHSPKTILDGKKYVENAVIVSSADSDRQDSLWVSFGRRYENKYGAEADRVAALGYDAARLVCQAVAAIGGGMDAHRFSDWLRLVQSHQGVSGLISFDPARGVNKEAVIMKILDRRFIRVQ